MYLKILVLILIGVFVCLNGLDHLQTEELDMEKMIRQWEADASYVTFSPLQKKYLKKISQRRRGRGGKDRYKDKVHGRGNRRHKRQTENLPVRKSYRHLTDRERQDFHDAIYTLKHTFSDPASALSDFDLLVLLHNAGLAPSAHGGEGFPGWHRQYLVMFENALQDINENVALCYLDTTMENNIGARLEDSAIFGPDTLGNADGEVVTGPFANFTVFSRPCVNLRPTLFRNIRSEPFRYYSRGDLLRFDTWDTFEELSTSRPTFEAEHNGVHNGINGHMARLLCAPFDPAFWMHHAFVDYLWWELRQHQTTDLETEYPEVDFPHGPNDLMSPFTVELDDGSEQPLLNIDGLSNTYTTEEYTYQRAPGRIVCRRARDCRSKFLYCSASRCRAKVREGGQLEGRRNISCYCPRGFRAGRRRIGDLYYCICRPR